jgi:hypothetical protein
VRFSRQASLWGRTADRSEELATHANQPRKWVPRARGPRRQVFVAGVRIPRIWGPGKARLPINRLCIRAWLVGQGSNPDTIRPNFLAINPRGEAARLNPISRPPETRPKFALLPNYRTIRPERALLDSRKAHYSLKQRKCNPPFLGSPGNMLIARGLVPQIAWFF